MKVLYLFFLLCILGVYAQRRAAKPDGAELETSSQRPVSRGRGRARFTITQEFEQISPEYEEVTKHTRKTDTPRRKPEHAKLSEKRVPSRPKETEPKNRSYEVKEVLDDIPREDSRRHKKPRVITESKFEAANAPKKDLFTPSAAAPEELPLDLSFATSAVPESIAEETAIPAQLTTLPMNSVVSTEKFTEADLKNIETLPLDIPNASEAPAVDTELKRRPLAVPPASPSRKHPEPRRAPSGRAGTRTRGTTVAAEPTTPGSRVRTKTKLARKQEEPSAPIPTSSARSSFRPSRRRTEAVAESSHEPVRTRGPSVFSAENDQDLPSRSRTGRKVSSASERRIERNGSAESRATGRSRGGRISTSSRGSPVSTTAIAPEKEDLIQSRRESSRPTHSPIATSPSGAEKVDSVSSRRDGQSRVTQSTVAAPSALPENLDLITTRRESSRSTPSTSNLPANVPEKIELIPSARESNRPSSSTTGIPEKIDLISTRRSSKGRPSQSSSTTNVPDRSTSARRDSRRGSRITESPVEKTLTSRTSVREKATQASDARSQRRGPSRGSHERAESTTAHTERQSRGRARSRSFLTLNEQQLEVLPLFETEPKTVVHIQDSSTVPTKNSLGRRRSLNAAEDIIIASTKQTEVKVEVDPINEPPASSTQSSIRVSRQQSISVETKTEKTIRKVNKKRPTSPRTRPTRKHLPGHSDSKENQVKESVSVSEATEVTLTRKFVPHSKKNRVADSSKEERLKGDAQDKTNESDARKTVKVDEPKVSFRQVVRKATQKLPSKSKERSSGELTNSQEDIGEADNYPAPFKAAIQAKKGKKEGLGSRPEQTDEVSITNTTEKVATSSTASSAIDSSASSEASVAENVVNRDEETDRKSESESTTLTPSVKFPRPRFSLTTKHPKANETSSESTEKTGPARPSFPRKYKPGKSKPTTTTQGSTDQGEDSPTTTASPLQKFHARFKSRNQNNVIVTPRPAHKSRSYSPKAPKGVYSSRKFTRSSTVAPDAVVETEKPKPRKFNIETSALSTKIPPTGQGIKKASRFSSRYRSDILSRAAAHRTSTTVPAYVPTVPTITPPPTSVKIEENELGMEIISFDDPVANTVPSANLISGDYLSSSTDKTESSTPSTKTDPTSVVTMNTTSESAEVTITEINSFAKESKDTAAHTAEKPVSIIERIINSITAISTTATPDSATKTSTSTNGQATKSSAILNLVSKRPKDKTVDPTIESGAQKHTRSPNSVDYRTTEKPTTIIEKILSSLSAIRADTAVDSTTIDPMQVGSSFNTVDTTQKDSSTESISKIATATAPMSKETATTLPLVSNTLSVSTASSSSSSTLGFDTSSTIVPSSDLSTIPIATSSISPRSITITTPLSAQTTTTLNPTNFIDEISSEQTLPRRTIDKLLSLLNIVTPTTTTVQPTTTKVILVTPKMTTFVTTNTEPLNTDINATPIPTTLPTTAESTTSTTPQILSSSDATISTLFTSTLATPADISSNEVNLNPNPLAVSEPSVGIGSRILDVLSVISRMMTTSTANPSTTEILSTTTLTPSTSLPGSTTAISLSAFLMSGTPEGSTPTSTSAPTSTIVTSTGTPSDLTITTVTGTPETFTTVSGTGSPLSVPTTTVAESSEASTTSGSTVAVTNPSITVAITTPTTFSTPEGITTATVSGTTATATTPLAITTPGVTTQTDLLTSTSNPVPLILRFIGGLTAPPSPTTLQSTTSTEVSVVQGSVSNETPSNPTSTTVPPNTQTATLLTTVNTTPTLTSTTGTPLPLSTTLQQNEVTSTSTGTTGSSILTSTTKLIPETTTDSTPDVPSTLPTLANFEVSPDRVTVYSANDISSTFIPDDPATTVSIAARAFAPGTTVSAIAETTASNTLPPTMSTSQPTVGTTGVSSTVVASTSQSNVGSTIATPTTITSTPNSISSILTTTLSLANNNIISDMTAAPTTLSSILTTLTSVNTPNNKLDATTQDVSSNTIDTSSATDKQSLVNQTDVSNLANPLSTGTNAPESRSSSSGTTVSPPPLINTTTTITMTVMDRDGRVLQFEANPLQNDISSSPEPRDKDYFIFAVLPNNTILRKRPSKYPNKDTPFLIYGVLPNNTLVQKFPNGTIVPMEPTIQVIGFDTRDNPPPPPEIISNQVTSDQESRPDNKKVSTADVAQNTVPSSLDANLLSLNGIGRTTSTTLLPPLTELLGGRTVTAFNSIVDRTKGDRLKIQTLEVDPLIKSRLNLDNVELNTISSASSPPSPTPASALPSSTTRVTTTAIPLTTILSSTNPPGPPSTNPTTRDPTTGRPTTAFPSTTFFPTFLTTLFSTLQPQVKVTTTIPTTAAPTTTSQAPTPITTTFVPVTTTLIPAASTRTPVIVTAVPVTTTSAPVTTTSRVLYTSPVPRASPNALSIDVRGNDIPTPVPSTTLLDLLTKGVVSTTELPTTILSTTLRSLKDVSVKQRQLTEQQKQDLATLEALEKEQEAILQQLSFLTGLNVGNGPPPKGNDNLADRVLATAMGRLKGANKDSPNAKAPPAVNLLQALAPKDSRQPKSAAAPSVEDIVKQINTNGLNSATPPGPIVTSTYGKTNDALLASLLKEYGVGPTTPEALSAVFNKEIRSTTSAPKVTTTTTRRTTTTTQAPGRLMQGLNWLLNALAPPPTKRPQPKPKPKPQASSDEDELFNKQPTEINSVVVQPDESRTETAGISQDQLVALIKQLEDIQKDPKKARDLDLEALKTLQNAQANGKAAGVQVINTSSTGATSRTFMTTTGAPVIRSTKSAVPDNEIKPLIVNRGGTGKATTASSVGVSNSILEDVEFTPRGTIAPVDLKSVPGVAADLEAATTRTKIPPVKLNPVPGVPDESPRIRGQLVNYAINVTKAISSFLGSALQGAANSFQSLIGSGTRTAGNYRNSDSANRPG